jgi:hypothetical protein
MFICSKFKTKEIKNTKPLVGTSSVYTALVLVN